MRKNEFDQYLDYSLENKGSLKTWTLDEVYLTLT